jgi:hypothetical protein
MAAKRSAKGVVKKLHRSKKKSTRKGKKSRKSRRAKKK